MPTDVILVWAAVANVPTIELPVIVPLALIAPEAVTLPTNFILSAVGLPITALSFPSNPIRSRVAPPDNFGLFEYY